MNKKLAISFITIILLCMNTLSYATTVYITNSGKKYHTSNCSSLSKSKIEIELEDAISRGYSACSKCGAGSLSDEKNPNLSIDENKEIDKNNDSLPTSTEVLPIEEDNKLEEYLNEIEQLKQELNQKNLLINNLENDIKKQNEDISSLKEKLKEYNPYSIIAGNIIVGFITYKVTYNFTKKKMENTNESK